jgi:nucleoside-diphosphate-sugar epimerase
MRVVVIGGTGHIGTYLVPRLVDLGHEVVCVSRGVRKPYQSHAAWAQVSEIAIDRPVEEAGGRFGNRIAALDPEVVIDLICFTPDSARLIVEALRGRVQHFLHCGTIWVHGPAVEVPTTEEQPRRPFGDYGCRKESIEKYLLQEARQNGFPAMVLHPGHIVGPGWPPINPAGNRNNGVFENLASGKEVALPNLGLETLHHVHAADVAEAFVRAIARRSVGLGESFHVVSPAAVTLRGYAERVAAWFGREPRLRFLPWVEWQQTVSEHDAAMTWDHIAHSPNCSTAKSRRLLEYSPRYTSFEAIRESVTWMIANGVIRV